MKEKDYFKDFVQSSLKEEVNEIAFSQEMKNRVYQHVLEKKKEVKWFDRKISFSFGQFMVIVSIFILVIGFYGKSLFYISDVEREIICQQKQDIIIKQGNIPFGAVQSLVYDTDKERRWQEDEKTEYKS